MAGHGGEAAHDLSDVGEGGLGVLGAEGGDSARSGFSEAAGQVGIGLGVDAGVAVEHLRGGVLKGGVVVLIDDGSAW